MLQTDGELKFLTAAMNNNNNANAPREEYALVAHRVAVPS